MPIVGPVLLRFRITEKVSESCSQKAVLTSKAPPISLIKTSRLHKLKLELKLITVESSAYLIRFHYKTSTLAVDIHFGLI